MPDASAKAVVSAFKLMLSLLGIRDKVQEVWTDNGKQFLSVEFAALLRSALPGVRHCRIPPYAPQAGGWYEIPHRTENEVFRAVLAVTPVEDWQEVCDLAMTKINCTSPDGAPSPYLLWFGREPSVLADRFLSVAYHPARRGAGGGDGCSG